MPTSHPFPLKSKHEEILRAVYFYRYVTVADITRLFFSPASNNYVGQMLASLAGGKDYTDRQYLFRFPLPHTRSGNTEKIYTLGARGRAFLQELGMDVDWYFRPAGAKTMSYHQCLHALALTRFLVVAQMYCREQDTVHLADAQTEYTLKRLAPAVTITEQGSKGQVKVVPDAWLNFELLKAGTHESFLPVLLEIDRGNEYRTSFKRRIAARLAFVKKGGEYSRLFGTEAVTIAYLTTGGKEHFANMREWTREVISEQGKESYADLFRFCQADLSEITPNRLFTNPSWVGLDDDTPLHLLE